MAMSWKDCMEAELALSRSGSVEMAAFYADDGRVTERHAHDRAKRRKQLRRVMRHDTKSCYGFPRSRAFSCLVSASVLDGGSLRGS